MDTICDKTNCSGCEACKDICPNNAIFFEEDEKGFMYPKIDSSICTNCGLCQKKCPANQVINKKDYISSVAAYSLDEETRSKSSSGGIFSELAKQILSQGGFIVGAAFDKEKVLRHIVIDNIDDLYKLRGSKYVQSQTGNVYKEVKSLLDNSKVVLFSGTPCQIYGLKAFLNKDYSNLYTVDVLCHGVPSPLVFKKYLEEKKCLPDSDVNFRDKTLGWTNYNFTFETSNVKNQSSNESDTYFKGFVENLFLRESCYNCKYNILNSRSADISIGDFWGVENYYPELSDNKGISAVITYSKKGQELFDSIKSNLFVKNVKIEEIISWNPVLVGPHFKHKKSDLFFNSFKELGVINSIEKLLGINKKVAIINHIFSHDNYGAMMVSYSMEKIVEQLGYYPSTINIQVPGHSVLSDFKDKFLHFTKPYNFDSDLSDLNKEYKTFITGSDQVWRNWWNDDKIVKNFFLGFADKTKNLISYSASFGIDKFEGSKRLKSDIEKILRAYTGISVRENTGADICKNEFHKDATVVLDPTQLIDVKEYIKIIDSENLAKPIDNYLSYMVFPNEQFDTEETRTFVEELTKRLNLKIEYALKKENTVGKWLNIFKNADYVITDSFHGMMFSIIFKKQFICLINKAGGADRFMTIAGELGLKDRLFNDVNEINLDKLINNPIDYKLVDERLSNLRIKSIKFLQNALNQNVVDNGIKSAGLLNKISRLLIRTNNIIYKKKIYLLGFIPLLKIRIKDGKKIFYLFHFIPIFSKKED